MLQKSLWVSITLGTATPQKLIVKFSPTNFSKLYVKHSSDRKSTIPQNVPYIFTIMIIVFFTEQETSVSLFIHKATSEHTST